MKLIFTLLKRLYTKELTVVCFLLSLLSPCFSQICSSPGSVIYSLSNAGGIYPISTSNASVGSVVNSTSYGSSTSANSIGYNSVNGLFYYFQTAISGTKQFISYNPSTNSYTTLAPSPIAATVNRGCVSFNGTGYYCLDVNSNLYYYNITLNTWTLICSTFTDQFGNNVSTSFSSESSGDMAIDGYNNLWIVCSNGTKYGVFELIAPLPTSSVSSITVKQVVSPNTSTPGAGFVGIAFDPMGNIYMSTTTDLYILKTSTTLSHIGTFSVAGICGDLTSCNYPFNILPVNWVSFTASANDKQASLQWSVAQSVNNKGFYVERSIDNKTWENLGFVADNSGETFGETSYSFSDANPAPGTNYYRIHQVDNNNADSYSTTKSVTFISSSEVSVWPNPARSSIYINNSENDNNVKMQIIDPFGKLIAANTLHTGKNEINIANFPAGTYIVHTQKADGEIQNQKIVKL